MDYRESKMHTQNETSVKRNLNAIFADCTIGEVVQAHLQLMSVDDALIPAFSQDEWWPDHFDFNHFCQAKSEFEYQYMKKYVSPKFTEKESVVKCILDAYGAYGIYGAPCISEHLTKLKEKLKKTCNRNDKT